MAAKYRKIFASIWTDEKFAALTRTQRMIALYVLTAQVNRIGLFRLSPGMAVEDLGPDSDGKSMGIDEFICQLDAAVKIMGWERDAARNIVYIPTWWRHNPPANDSVLIGALSDIDDLPDTDLLRRFAGNTKYLPSERLEAWRDGINRYSHRVGHHADTMPAPCATSGAVSGAETLSGKTAPPRSQSSTPKADPRSTLIPPHLDTDVFRAAWSKWLQYRKDNRYSCRAMTLDEQIGFLASMDEPRAVEAITTSIRNGWKGVFSPKDQTNGKQHDPYDGVRKAIANADAHG